jgi:hypothetical protein
MVAGTASTVEVRSRTPRISRTDSKITSSFLDLSFIYQFWHFILFIIIDRIFRADEDQKQQFIFPSFGLYSFNVDRLEFIEKLGEGK